MVNIIFTVTPMSALGSAALLTLLRLSGTHRCCLKWGGSVFILVIRRGVCVNAAVYFKAISPMTLPIGSLFLSTYTTLHTLFGFLPVPCVHCCGFRDYGTPQRSTLCLVISFFRRLLHLLIIIRPNTPIFLTDEQLACYFFFCVVLLCWYLLTIRFRL